MPAKPPRRQVLLLAGLVVVLAAILWTYTFGGTTEPPPAERSSGAQARPAREAAALDRAESVPGVRLSALSAGRPVPTGGGRNLFGETPKAPAPAQQAAQPSQTDPNAPPPPPPITLRLIGIVQGSGGPIAALTDGKDVFFGRQGDIIEGRYKILKVNVESIDIAYVDGRGQRRLGLSG